MTTEQRITVLEQQVRRQQSYGIIGLAVAVILIAFAGTNAGRVQEEVKAQKILITDKNGNVQISMEADEDGGAIFVKDQNGDSKVVIANNGDGGFVVVNHKNGKPGIMIGSTDNQPGCLMYDGAGITLFRLQTDADGGPLFAMRNANTPIVQMSEVNGVPKIRLEKAGKVIWSAP